MLLGAQVQEMTQPYQHTQFVLFIIIFVIRSDSFEIEYLPKANLKTTRTVYLTSLSRSLMFTHTKLTQHACIAIYFILNAGGEAIRRPTRRETTD